MTDITKCSGEARAYVVRVSYQRSPHVPAWTDEDWSCRAWDARDAIDQAAHHFGRSWTGVRVLGVRPLEGAVPSNGERRDV